MLPVIIGFGALGVLLVALARQQRLAWLHGIAGGLLVSYGFIAVVFLLGEAYFRFAYAESENTVTRATENWLARHWQTNSLGYRDREWTPADWQDKTTVLVTGDSFTAGWGIDDPADRYTDVLAGLLGENYAVFNLGIYGTATVEQLENLRAFPVENPDVVVLQYFLNDINYTMLRMGVLPDPQPAPDWAQESYLLNFLYTRLLARFLDPQFNVDWWQENYDAYDNAELWALHQEELQAYIDYTRALNARLIVVIFPNMLDPVRSVAYVDRVAQFFQAQGVSDVLKLFDAAAAWSLQDRIVSPRDTHPSVAFHRYVAEEIDRLFFAEESR
jgi:lysophospholipase L1-like esterase